MTAPVPPGRGDPLVDIDNEYDDDIENDEVENEAENDIDIEQENDGGDDAVDDDDEGAEPSVKRLKKATNQLASGGAPVERQNDISGGSSCHQCKSRRTHNGLSFCNNQLPKKNKSAGAMCRKKYCDHCLKKFYQTDPPTGEDALTWKCPACNNQCSCAACRKKGQKERALPSSHPIQSLNINGHMQPGMNMYNNSNGSPSIYSGMNFAFSNSSQQMQHQQVYAMSSGLTSHQVFENQQQNLLGNSSKHQNDHMMLMSSQSQQNNQGQDHSQNFSQQGQGQLNNHQRQVSGLGQSQNSNRSSIHNSNHMMQNDLLSPSGSSSAIGSLQSSNFLSSASGLSLNMGMTSNSVSGTSSSASNSVGGTNSSDSSSLRTSSTGAVSSLNSGNNSSTSRTTSGLGVGSGISSLTSIGKGLGSSLSSGLNNSLGTTIGSGVGNLSIGSYQNNSTGGVNISDHSSHQGNGAFVSNSGNLLSTGVFSNASSFGSGSMQGDRASPALKTVTNNSSAHSLSILSSQSHHSHHRNEMTSPINLAGANNIESSPLLSSADSVFTSKYAHTQPSFSSSASPPPHAQEMMLQASGQTMFHNTNNHSYRPDTAQGFPISGAQISLFRSSPHLSATSSSPNLGSNTTLQFDGPTSFFHASPTFPADGRKTAHFATDINPSIELGTGMYLNRTVAGSVASVVNASHSASNGAGAGGGLHGNPALSILPIHKTQYVHGNGTTAFNFMPPPANLSLHPAPLNSMSSTSATTISTNSGFTLLGLIRQLLTRVNIATLNPDSIGGLCQQISQVLEANMPSDAAGLAMDSVKQEVVSFVNSIQSQVNTMNRNQGTHASHSSLFAENSLLSSVIESILNDSSYNSNHEGLRLALSVAPPNLSESITSKLKSKIKVEGVSNQSQTALEHLAQLGHIKFSALASNATSTSGPTSSPLSIASSAPLNSIQVLQKVSELRGVKPAGALAAAVSQSQPSALWSTDREKSGILASLTASSSTSTTASTSVPLSRYLSDVTTLSNASGIEGSDNAQSSHSETLLSDTSPSKTASKDMTKSSSSMDDGEDHESDGGKLSETNASVKREDSTVNESVTPSLEDIKAKLRSPSMKLKVEELDTEQLSPSITGSLVNAATNSPIIYQNAAGQVFYTKNLDIRSDPLKISASVTSLPRSTDGTTVSEGSDSGSMPSLKIYRLSNGDSSVLPVHSFPSLVVDSDKMGSNTVKDHESVILGAMRLSATTSSSKSASNSVSNSVSGGSSASSSASLSSPSNNPSALSLSTTMNGAEDKSISPSNTEGDGSASSSYAALIPLPAASPDICNDEGEESLSGNSSSSFTSASNPVAPAAVTEDSSNTLSSTSTSGANPNAAVSSFLSSNLSHFNTAAPTFQYVANPQSHTTAGAAPHSSGHSFSSILSPSMSANVPITIPPTGTLQGLVGANVVPSFYLSSPNTTGSRGPYPNPSTFLQGGQMGSPRVNASSTSTRKPSILDTTASIAGTYCLSSIDMYSYSLCHVLAHSSGIKEAMQAITDRDDVSFAAKVDAITILMRTAASAPMPDTSTSAQGSVGALLSTATSANTAAPTPAPFNSSSISSNIMTMSNLSLNGSLTSGRKLTAEMLSRLSPRTVRRLNDNSVNVNVTGMDEYDSAASGATSTRSSLASPSISKSSALSLMKKDLNMGGISSTLTDDQIIKVERS